ncbi:transcription termination/antitermination protein NusA [Candidatus Saccharibacteria bacterium]|nr:transcription termination/antitermination protein NusA [Candidatus Saccharibacteria bacterium]MCB9834776.1 transcription termination/antitermination protein NusA [Candidatus Nomurabacteria bacterium]
MNTQFISALEQICDEKNIPKQTLLDAIQEALIAAYRRDFLNDPDGENQDQEVRVFLHPETGEFKLYVDKKVVEVVENNSQISLEDARKLKGKEVKLGDYIEVEEDSAEFGRVAAQTAKHVMLQKIREAEKSKIADEYRDQIGKVITVNIGRSDNMGVRVDLANKGQGIIYPSGQIPGERLYPGLRVKVLVEEVDQEKRGPAVVLSRTSPDFIKGLFEAEVPEIGLGSVEVMKIVREPGIRSKISVRSDVNGIDPVGTLVGGRGVRVQAVLNELGNEKIDIVEYSDDPVQAIQNALKPTEVESIEFDQDQKLATVRVRDDQYSLAIGSKGMNVKLAAKLLGIKIDVVNTDDSVESIALEAALLDANEKDANQANQPV